MKNNKFFLAICTMALAASVAVVSCKKETQSNLMDSKTETLQIFNPLEIEDMNAYLKGFKQKMQSAVKGDDEALSLEDAAWHLSSLSNYEFAKYHAEYNNLRFDTLYSTVKVTMNSVLLSDLALSYENIIKSISDFYHNLMLENKGVHFINVSISESGDIAVSLITTFMSDSKFLLDTCYFYPSYWYATIDCYNYFDEFVDLPVQSTGTTELRRVINLVGNDPLTPEYYFTQTSSEVFYFDQNFDPYGSPSLWNSRLYAKNSSFNYYDLKPYDEICYYLDSYLGLGIHNRPSGKYIISWSLSLKTEYVQYYNLSIQHHELTVNYGDKHRINPNPGGDPLD